MKNLIPRFIQERLDADEHRGEITAIALFMDVSGFTPMTERLMQQGKEGAEALNVLFNGIFVPVVEIIYHRGGFVSGFAGDALLALFPGDDVLSCATAARELQVVFARHSSETRFGTFNLSAKVGIAHGRVEWGIVGSLHRNYYFRGPAVDGCALAEHRAAEGQIIVDRSIHEDPPPGMLLEELPRAEDGSDFNDGYRLLVDAPAPPDHAGAPPPSADVREEISIQFVPRAIVDRARIGGGEFRNVICLFIAFRAGMSHDELDHLSRDLMEGVMRRGGYYENLDFGDKGATILCLFGAPVSYEDDVHRALSFAGEMRERYGADLRIGATYGTAFAGFLGSPRRGYYTGMGDVVNLSARLCMHAPMGEVELSRPLAENARGLFEVSFLEAAALKGKSKPVDIFRLGQRRGDAPRLREESGSFCGRDAELETLAERVGALRQGGFGGVFYIYGDAGVGKTRMFHEMRTSFQEEVFFAEMRADGVLRKSLNPFERFLSAYLFSRDELPEEQPADGRPRGESVSIERLRQFDSGLGQLYEAILSKAGDTPETRSLIAELRRTRPALGALLGLHFIDPDYDALDARARFDNTLLAIKEFFRGLAMLQPVVLFLDDLNFIDEESLSAVRFLTRNMEDVPLMIVAAGRIRDAGTRPAFRLDETVPVAEVVLAGLAREPASALVTARLGRYPSPALLDFLAERTGGNPYFLEELCEFLLAGSCLVVAEPDPDASTLPEDLPYELGVVVGELPAGIASVLVARIDRMPFDLRETVQTAAVLGQEFEARVLERLVSGVAPEALPDLLQRGERERIWGRVGNAYVFNENLLREAAYDMQSRERLRELHRGVAERMEELYGREMNRRADIAFHYEKAELFDQAREHLSAAARFARNNFNNDQALEYYERLLEYSRSEIESMEICWNRAAVLEIAGRWQEAEAELDKGLKIARNSSDPRRGAGLQCLLGEIYQKQGRYDEAVATFEEAVSAAGEQITAGECMLHLGRTFWFRGEYSRALEQLRKALLVKTQTGDRRGEGLALYYTGVVERDKGRYENAMRSYEKARGIFESINDRRLVTYPLYDLGVLYRYRGEPEPAAAHMEESARIYREIGYASGLSAAVLNLGELARMRGEYDEARVRLEESLRIAREVGEPLAIAYANFSLGALLYDQREFEAALAPFERAFTIMRSIGARGYYGYVLSYLSCLFARQGKRAKALKLAELNARNVHALNSDVENGRGHLAVGLALSTAPPPAPGTRAATSLAAWSRTTGVAPEPAACFETAIEIARKARYVNTLVPAMREFGLYLIGQGRMQEGRESLAGAQIAARKAGMQGETRRIDEICARFNLELE